MEVGFLRTSQQWCPRSRGGDKRGPFAVITTALTTSHKQFLTGKMPCYLYLSFVLLSCCLASGYAHPGSSEQATNYVYSNDGTPQNKFGQYFEHFVSKNDGGLRDSLDQKTELILDGPLANAQRTSHYDVTKAEKVTLTAEITFGLKDFKRFLRELVSGSHPPAHLSSSDHLGGHHPAPPRRATRDTDPRASSETSSGPWQSNLSPAAIVGTIVGGTVGIFVIVVLTVIFCSYRNYPSLEMRQRTADVYDRDGYGHGHGHGDGHGYGHAERRV